MTARSRWLPQVNLRVCLSAFVASFSVLFFELVFFQQLHFLTSYMSANLVISVALLGLAAGGLSAFFLAKWAEHVMPLALLLIGPAAAGAFFFATQYQDSPFKVAVAMTVPFLLAAIVVSLAFSREKRTGFIYASDLAGAGVGALAAALFLPLLREEGCALIFASVLVLVSVVGLGPSQGRAFKVAFVVLALGFCAVGVWASVLQLVDDRLNMVFIAKDSDDEAIRSKIYNRDVDDERVYSFGSLIERIDAYRAEGRGTYHIFYNGLPNDHVSRVAEHFMVLDRRLPVTLFRDRIEEPQVLVIGASAEGINKPAKAVAGEKGKVTGLEYNEAIVRMALNEVPHMHFWGMYWYEGMDLRIEDARTYLARTDELYDVITMLNTHKVKTIGVEGPPEYLHTVESIHSYMDHLTDEGAIVIEERLTTADGGAGMHNYVATIAAALRERGLDPLNHIIVYDYYSSDRRGMLRRGISTTKDRFIYFRYGIILVFKSDISQDAEVERRWNEWRYLVDHMHHYASNCGGKNHCSKKIKKQCRKERMLEYYDKVAEVRCVIEKMQAGDCKCRWSKGLLDVRVRHSPWRDYDTTFTAAIAEEEPRDVLAEDGYVLSVARNDRPFIQDVDAAQPEVDEMLGITATAGAILVFPLLLALALVIVLSKKEPTGPRPHKGLRAAELVLFGVFSGVVGLAYILIEIVLVQWFAMFMGSPTSSLSVILPGMLVFSGIGGIVSERLGAGKVLLAMAAIVVIALIFNATISPLLHAMVALGSVSKVLVSLALLAPLFIAMGVPFSFALKRAYRSFSPSYPALFFGINGALGALATPIAIKLAMNLGFDAAMKIGAALYGGMMLIVGFAMIIDRKSSSESATDV